MNIGIHELIPGNKCCISVVSWNQLCKFMIYIHRQ